MKGGGDMKDMEWYVVYGNDLNGTPTRCWNCEDSEVEAIRVYEYFKFIFSHVIMYHDGKIVHEYKRYFEGEEES
jgi:hypothetical protein